MTPMENNREAASGGEGASTDVAVGKGEAVSGEAAGGGGVASGHASGGEVSICRAGGGVGVLTSARWAAAPIRSKAISTGACGN